MIVGINITFYLDSYLFKSLALFFCHRADLTCRQMQEFQVTNLKKNGNICYNAGPQRKVSHEVHIFLSVESLQVFRHLF